VKDQRGVYASSDKSQSPEFYERALRAFNTYRGDPVAIGSLGTFIAGPTPALVWAMYADCADYGEWKSGRRTTALIFSGAQFAQKLGLAVGAGLSGYILFLFGFVSNQVQSAASMAGIRLMFSVFPAVLADRR
jgi:GPH family glycoside/pentoside/hexuronide:cation symporter